MELMERSYSRSDSGLGIVGGILLVRRSVGCRMMA